MKRSYTYAANGSNDAGLVNKMTDEDGNNTNYNYDGKNRLTSTNGTDAGSWTYDKDGNRTKATSGGTTRYSQYDNADQLCWDGPTDGTGCSNAPADAASYTSDGTGNQLTDTTTAGAATNANNVFNQTTQTSIGNTAVPFTYADTTNTERLTSGNTTYTNGNAGLDAQTTGNATTYYVRDASGTLIAMRSGGTSYYYALDALGSVIALNDGNQITVASYRYGPWGNQTIGNGSMANANPWRYATGYLDTTTGYLKLGARYYNSRTGRFVQPDPKSTWGGYAYTDNNPINRTDSTGQDWISDGLGFVSDVASVVSFAGYATGNPIVGAVAGGIGLLADAGKAGYDCGQSVDGDCGQDVAGLGADAVWDKIGGAWGAGFGLAYTAASNIYDWTTS